MVPTGPEVVTAAVVDGVVVAAVVVPGVVTAVVVEAVVLEGVPAVVEVGAVSKKADNLTLHWRVSRRVLYDHFQRGVSAASNDPGLIHMGSQPGSFVPYWSHKSGDTGMNPWIFNIERMS